MTEKTAVHTPTKEEYDRLMKAYEKKGWEPVLGHFGYGTWGFTRITFEDKYQGVGDNCKEYSNIITVDEAIAKLGLYERGQEVLVSNDNVNRKKMYYIDKIEWRYYPYIVMREYLDLTVKCNGESETFRYIKPLEPTTLELTMKDIEDKFQCKVKIVK